MRALAGFSLIATLLIAHPALSVGAGGLSSPPGLAELTPREAAIVKTFRRGVQMMGQGDYSGALKNFSSVVKADPGNADGIAYLGLALEKVDRPDLAFKSYRRALLIDPHHREAHEFLGSYFLTRDEPAKARKLLARLRDLCPFGCAEETGLGRAIADYEAQRAALTPAEE